MISVTATNDAGRALAQIVAFPGQLDAEDIGMLLYRPKLTGTKEYLAFRKTVLNNTASWCEKASKLLHRLQQKKLILPLQPPTAGPEYRGNETNLSPLEVALMQRLVRESPPTMQAWVGSAPPGNVQRAITRLRTLRMLIHPHQRQPSLDGILLVLSWNTP